MVNPDQCSGSESNTDQSKSDDVLELENYIVGETIGEGTFGKVKVGQHKLTGEKVAIKILNIDKITDQSDVDRISREIKILKTVRHPHVVQLYEIIETDTRLFLIMEFVPGGELFDYIVQQGRLSEVEACRFFRQLLSGLEMVHALGISHRDLKPENLLLDDELNIKIADFGLSNTFNPGQTLITACGSPCYAPPEMVGGEAYDPCQSDMWSSGVILYAMVCGYLPFENESTSKLYGKILEGDFVMPTFLTPLCRHLILSLLTVDPAERATIANVKEHPWFAHPTVLSSDGVAYLSGQSDPGASTFHNPQSAFYLPECFVFGCAPCINFREMLKVAVATSQQHKDESSTLPNSDDHPNSQVETVVATQGLDISSGSPSHGSSSGRAGLFSSSSGGKLIGGSTNPAAALMMATSSTASGSKAPKAVASNILNSTSGQFSASSPLGSTISGHAAVLRQMKKLGFEEQDVRTQLAENRHNLITTSFFLLLAKRERLLKRFEMGGGSLEGSAAVGIDAFRGRIHSIADLVFENGSMEDAAFLGLAEYLSEGDEETGGDATEEETLFEALESATLHDDDDDEQLKTIGRGKVTSSISTHTLDDDDDDIDGEGVIENGRRQENKSKPRPLVPQLHIQQAVQNQIIDSYLGEEGGDDTRDKKRNAHHGGAFDGIFTHTKGVLDSESYISSAGRSSHSPVHNFQIRIHNNESGKNTIIDDVIDNSTFSQQQQQQYNNDNYLNITAFDEGLTNQLTRSVAQESQVSDFDNHDITEKFKQHLNVTDKNNNASDKLPNCISSDQTLSNVHHETQNLKIGAKSALVSFPESVQFVVGPSTTEFENDNKETINTNGSLNIPPSIVNAFEDNNAQFTNKSSTNNNQNIYKIVIKSNSRSQKDCLISDVNCMSNIEQQQKQHVNNSVVCASDVMNQQRLQKKNSNEILQKDPSILNNNNYTSSSNYTSPSNSCFGSINYNLNLNNNNNNNDIIINDANNINSTVNINSSNVVHSHSYHIKNIQPQKHQQYTEPTPLTHYQQNQAIMQKQQAQLQPSLPEAAYGLPSTSVPPLSLNVRQTFPEDSYANDNNGVESEPNAMMDDDADYNTVYGVGNHEHQRMTSFRNTQHQNTMSQHHPHHSFVSNANPGSNENANNNNNNNTKMRIVCASDLNAPTPRISGGGPFVRPLLPPAPRNKIIPPSVISADRHELFDLKKKRSSSTIQNQPSNASLHSLSQKQQKQLHLSAYHSNNAMQKQQQRRLINPQPSVVRRIAMVVESTQNAQRAYEPQINGKFIQNPAKAANIKLRPPHITNAAMLSHHRSLKRHSIDINSNKPSKQPSQDLPLKSNNFQGITPRTSRDHPISSRASIDSARQPTSNAQSSSNKSNNAKDSVHKQTNNRFPSAKRNSSATPSNSRPGSAVAIAVSHQQHTPRENPHVSNKMRQADKSKYSSYPSAINEAIYEEHKQQLRLNLDTAILMNKPTPRQQPDAIHFESKDMLTSRAKRSHHASQKEIPESPHLLLRITDGVITSSGLAAEELMAIQNSLNSKDQANKSLRAVSSSIPPAIEREQFQTWNQSFKNPNIKQNNKNKSVASNRNSLLFSNQPLSAITPSNVSSPSRNIIANPVTQWKRDAQKVRAAIRDVNLLVSPPSPPSVKDENTYFEGVHLYNGKIDNSGVVDLGENNANEQSNDALIYGNLLDDFHHNINNSKHSYPLASNRIPTSARLQSDTVERLPLHNHPHTPAMPLASTPKVRITASVTPRPPYPPPASTARGAASPSTFHKNKNPLANSALVRPSSSSSSTKLGGRAGRNILSISQPPPQSPSLQKSSRASHSRRPIVPSALAVKGDTGVVMTDDKTPRVSKLVSNKFGGHVISTTDKSMSPLSSSRARNSIHHNFDHAVSFASNNKQKIVLSQDGSGVNVDRFTKKFDQSSGRHISRDIGGTKLRQKQFL